MLAVGAACYDNPAMSQSVLLFVGDEYEDLEVHYPRLRLREAGYAPVMAGVAAGATYTGKHGYPCVSDVALHDVDTQAYIGLVIPGGWMPDKLRRDVRVLGFVRAFDQAGLLVASICHGGWICISAGIVRGRTYTGSPGIRDDLVNAGAVFKDAPVVVDGHHVSSRKPDDLPEFMKAVLEVLQQRR
jgi:protease I